MDGTRDFNGCLNHYISVHGYYILHIGQETSTDMEGRPWQSTVAILGTDEAIENYIAQPSITVSL
jgi:hypothetical protein